MLNIAQDSQAWQPKWSVGPFLKGQAGVVIELQPRRSTSVEVRVDDVAVERFKLGVLRDRWIRDESAGLPSVPATMVSYESDGGRVLIDGPLQANDIAKVSLEDPKSETWFRAENVHIDQSSGVRRCIFSLKTLNLAITVEDAITGIPIPGATIELLDSPGGVSHALIRASALQGALPTVSLARLTSDANGSAFTRIVTCKSPLYSVQAVGYADLLGAASSIVEPHLTLHPVARLRGTVAMPQSGSNWDARLKFTPTESHNFREVREVPVTKGSFVVDEIAYGDFAVELRTGPAEPLVAIDLGVLRYSGQDYEEFDAGSYHWTEVIFDTRGVQANLFDIMNVYARSTGWLLPVDVKDGLPQHLWLPQGRYFFAWQSQSIETAAPMLAHVAFDVLAGQKTLVVPVGFSGLPCQVEFRTDAGPLVNAWVCLPGYPYRRTDDNGYVFLEEPLQPGAKVWALTDQLLPAGGQVELHEMNMNGAQFLRADLGDLKPTGR